MDTFLFVSRFLAVVERDGYIFVREVRCGGNIVSVLPFRNTGTGQQYLARRETCPAHASINQQPELCSITGGVDSGTSPLETARLELLEEAGYSVDPGEFVPLGNVKPSKAMDTVAHLFAIDVSDKRPQAAMGDGSKWEVGASVVWVSEGEGLEIGDPLFIAALARLSRRIPLPHRG